MKQNPWKGLKNRGVRSLALLIVSVVGVTAQAQTIQEQRRVAIIGEYRRDPLRVGSNFCTEADTRVTSNTLTLAQFRDLLVDFCEFQDKPRLIQQQALLDVYDGDLLFRQVLDRGIFNIRTERLATDELDAVRLESEAELFEDELES